MTGLKEEKKKKKHQYKLNQKRKEKYCKYICKVIGKKRIYVKGFK